MYFQPFSIINIYLNRCILSLSDISIQFPRWLKSESLLSLGELNTPAVEEEGKEEGGERVCGIAPPPRPRVIYITCICYW